MKTVKTYPPAVEAQRQFFLAEIEKYWATVHAECQGLPPEAVKARIQRAWEIELALFRDALVGCERQANLSILMTKDEARAAGVLFPTADD